jgi:hypothetical protein
VQGFACAVGELMKVDKALISSKEQSRYLRFFLPSWRELEPMKHGIKGSLCSNRAEFRLVMVRHRIGVEKRKTCSVVDLDENYPEDKLINS